LGCTPGRDARILSDTPSGHTAKDRSRRSISATSSRTAGSGATCVDSGPTLVPTRRTRPCCGRRRPSRWILGAENRRIPFPAGSRESPRVRASRRNNDRRSHPPADQLNANRTDAARGSRSLGIGGPAFDQVRSVWWMAIERCPSGDRTRLHSSISSRVGRTVLCPNVLCSPTLGDVSDADRHPDNMDGVRCRWSLRHEGASFDSCRESRLLSTGCRVPVDASADAQLRAAESGWSRVGALVAAVVLQVAYATHRNPWV